MVLVEWEIKKSVLYLMTCLSGQALRYAQTIPITPQTTVGSIFEMLKARYVDHYMYGKFYSEATQAEMKESQNVEKNEY